jgi:3',5'-cyclic AMP phosphodiesterase CpdA
MGDFGVGGEAESSLGATMQEFEKRRPAQLLITLGDNDYTESPELFARNWRASFGWLESAGVRVTGTLGNHDVRVDEGRYEFSLLGMPGRYYSRRAGDVEVFALDSNALDGGQTSWLRRRLAASTARWKIVAFHHPAYTCGEYRSTTEVVRSWVPLFERYAVQLVLSGHDHNYQRFRPRGGVTYVVHGGGQTNLYGIEACPAGYPRRVVAREERGFLYLLAAKQALRGFAVDADGRVVDRFTIYP